MEDLDGDRIQVAIYAYSGLEEGAITAFSGTATYSHRYYFFDYYTGYLLADNKNFMTSDGEYYYEFESTDGWVDLYIDAESNHRSDVSGYSSVYEYEITFNFPSWYDGLVFSLVPYSGSYSNYLSETDYFLGVNSYECILDLPWGVDVYNGANCRIW